MYRCHTFTDGSFGGYLSSADIAVNFLYHTRFSPFVGNRVLWKQVVNYLKR